GRGDALTKADDAREGVDDAKAVARRACDEEAAIIGAEIERRIGGAGLALISPVAGVRTPTPPATGMPCLVERRAEATGVPGLVVHFRTFPSRRCNLSGLNSCCT